MIVFGIDPGPEKSAYVKWDGLHISYMGISPNEDLLKFLPILDSDYLAIEQIKSYGMPVSDSIFDTVFWSGRFIQAWYPRFYKLIPRLQVKLHICHDSRAKDSNIRASLISRFGEQGTKKSPGPTYGLKKDIWSAFAVAVTFWDYLETKDG